MDDSLKLTKQQLERLDKVTTIGNFFSNFKDPTRLKIIYALKDGFPRNATSLCELLGITKSNLSHQMSILKSNKIVEFEKKGKNIFYRLDDEHISTILNTAYNHLFNEEK